MYLIIYLCLIIDYTYKYSAYALKNNKNTPYVPFFIIHAYLYTVSILI